MIPVTGQIERIECGKAAICRDILLALPEWFAIPQSIEDYVRAVEHLPMFMLRMDGAIAGFLALKYHTAAAAEAYVLGVKKPWHRRGGGRLLLSAAEADCRAAGMCFLTVKTLAASHPDPFYARTRAFYEAMGFMPLEVFATLWNADNPCLLMVKVLEPERA